MRNNVIKDSRPPKVYRIEHDEKKGTVIVHVGIKWPAGTSWRLLGHCKLHSPTGFEIGYGGSGPADTAASILADYFEEDPSSVEPAWRGRSNGRPSVAIKLHRWVTQLLRQGDAKVFKKYSQMKLQMKREALQK